MKKLVNQVSGANAIVKKDKLMELSQQQQDVLNWAERGNGSLNLIARAGCGKTTTLLELVEHLHGEVFLGAYNKAIATELQQRLSAKGIPWKKAQAGTLHSAGFGAWRKVAPAVKVDGKKVYGIIDQMKLDDPARKDDLERFGNFINKAVSLAKQRAFGVLCAVEDRSHWFNLIEHFGLEEELEGNGHGYNGHRSENPPDLEPVIDLCIAVFKKSIEMDREMVDFDDMILAPLIHNIKIWPKDWVLIDEAQDTNPARRALAMKMLKPKTGRLIAVGDPAQAIYGFTGADDDSMVQIQRQLNSSELPLNVTYRCPKQIVSLAQTWVTDITAADAAPEGLVRSIRLNGENGQPGFWNESLKQEDVILCRNTKPLVELAYSLLRRGVACRVEGREIGTGLIKLIRKWKVTRINGLITALGSYQERECQKWLAKGREEKAAAIEDQVETIVVLAEKLQAEGKHEVEDLVNFINSLFGDTEPGVTARVLTLSTVHKAKGREWERVFILGRNKFMPSRWARKDWQAKQEYNLCYVAVTRAKAELVDIVVE